MQSKYDQSEINFLCSSFKHGFDLGYQGLANVQQRLPNLKLCVGSATKLWNKVMNKVIKFGRYAGPYKQIPFKNYIQSPIGLVPKDNGKDVCLIFHLSYPRDQRFGYSINANTPRHWCTVSYPDFN